MSGSLSAHGSPNSLELSKVKQVVTGIEAQEIFDALLAPLGMDADALQVGRRCAIDQLQVGAAKQREYRHRLVRIGVRIVQPIGPQILVITDDLGAILRENHPQSPAPHEVRISQVLKHVNDGPLARLLRPSQLIRRETTDRMPDRRRRLVQHGQRIIVAEKIEYRTGIPGPFLGRIDGTIAKD